MNQLKEAILIGSTPYHIDETLTIPDLLSFFIEFYANHCISGNLHFIDSLNAKLHALSKYNKHNEKSAELLQKICELLHKHCSEKNMFTNFIKQNMQLNMDMASLELILQSSKNFTAAKYLEDINDGISHNMFKILTYISKLKSKTELVKIIHYLLNENRISADTIKCDEMFADKKIKQADKKDIIWYIWFVLLYNTDVSDDMKILSYLNYSIFCLKYKKADRMLRKNIIIYLFIIQNSRNAEKYIQRSRRLQHHHHHRSKTDEAPLDIEYLKVLTYADNNLKNEIMQEREIYNKQFELENL